MKKLAIALNIVLLSSCAELQQVASQLPEGTLTSLSTLGSGELSSDYIASGLREALNQGIEKQVAKLTQADGFLKNELVKIVLPEELQAVDSGLRKIGLNSLADRGLELMNRAAEDAVGEATPIFIDAVKGITFDDAKNILLAEDGAATNYLNTKTNSALYSKFSPVIQNSLSKVGADSVWSEIISRYNSIPFTNRVDPDLTNYITGKALDGVYTMIAVEESTIRNEVSSRKSKLLQQVFALQD